MLKVYFLWEFLLFMRLNGKKLSHGLQVFLLRFKAFYYALGLKNYLTT